MRSILLAFALLLAGCGLKDDLYLPDTEPAGREQAADDRDQDTSDRENREAPAREKQDQDERDETADGDPA